MGSIITPGHPNFHIHKRNYREIEAVLPTVGVCGHYRIERIKPDFGIIGSLEFPNLITDLGLDTLGGVFNWIRCHLGTGTATPHPTDVSLSSFGVNVQAANPSMTNGNSGTPDYYQWGRYTWLSAIGGATGNWTEIGISDQNTNGNLRSRALILDQFGNPTTFTVLSDEQIQVFYEFRTYLKLTDTLSTISVSGVDYNTITRPTSVQYITQQPLDSGFAPWMTNGQSFPYSGNIGIVTGEPTGALSGTAPTALSAYTNGNFYRDSTTTAGAGTATGTWRSRQIGSVSGMRSFQIQYDKVAGGGGIVKGAAQQLILNQRSSWARR